MKSEFIDAMRLRYWRYMAVNQPCRMAKLLVECITEDQINEQIDKAMAEDLQSIAKGGYRGDTEDRVSLLVRQNEEKAELIQEFVNLCFVGDVDEETDALGWGDLIKRAKETVKNTLGDYPHSVTFQSRVNEWMQVCFGPEISKDLLERNDRFLEEALELVQACDYSKERAYQMVDYVFSRPVGEKSQEVGGVKVTLAALCNAQRISMYHAAEVELRRIWGCVEKIREKQKTKPKGSALPQPVKDGV